MSPFMTEEDPAARMKTEGQDKNVHNLKRKTDSKQSP